MRAHKGPGKILSAIILFLFSGIIYIIFADSMSDMGVDDSIITQQIEDIFAKEHLLSPEQTSAAWIDVKTKNGVVYLTGQGTIDQAEKAVELAKSASGVKKVDAEIHTC